MALDIRSAVVAFLDSNGNIVGTGFLVEKNLIVTCAHVIVESGAAAGDAINIRWEKDESISSAHVLPEYWSDRGEYDVAFIRVDKTPAGVYPFSLDTSARSNGRTFISFGYATASDVQGLISRGEIIGNVKQGKINVIQISSNLLDHGMSGAPLIDESLGAVIGMVWKGSTDTSKFRDVAFAIPSETLVQINSGLKLIQSNISSNELTSNIPNAQTSESPLPNSSSEDSEVINPYTIQDNALEKHAATDKPIQDVEHDKLGFGVYVTALHDFIVSQFTTTPLTISVDGPWGTGKSSLMYMLKNNLEPQNNIWQRFVAWLKNSIRWWMWFFWWFLALPVQTFGRILLRIVLKFDKNTQEFDFRVGKNNSGFRSLITDIAQGLSTNPEVLQQVEKKQSLRVIWWANVHAKCEPLEPVVHPTIWLNAWKFDNQEEVWASLALSTLEQIKKKHNIFWMAWFRIRLTFKRLSFLSALGTLLFQFALPLVLGVVAFYYSVILESFETPLKAFDTITQGFGNYLLWVGGILSGILTVSSIFKDPFQISVDKVFDRPNYKEKVGFLTRFEHDFAKVIELATSNGFGWKKSKLIIFIDDLDRCEPPKSADIVEAINLFLDADGCVFVIGMDSESVAKSIEVKYKDLFDRIKAENGGVVSLGRAFLEKIVQIPFTVPRATPGQILNMVEDTLGRNISKGIAIKQAQEKLVVIAPENDQDVVEGENQTPIQTESIPQPETTADGKPDVKLDPASFEREEVRQAIRLGTKLLSENPRQVKTFVNLFRLSIYIANARGFFEEGRNGEKLRLIGLDRLAIWVTCSVRWQNLIRHLYTETQMNSLCIFLSDVSKNITPEYKWTTGHKNIPTELKKKIDNMRKGEKSSEAHWCHLPWDWWLLEPDFLQVVKRMEDLWALPVEGEAEQLEVLLNMSRPLSPTSAVDAK